MQRHLFRVAASEAHLHVLHSPLTVATWQTPGVLPQWNASGSVFGVEAGLLIRHSDGHADREQLRTFHKPVERILGPSRLCSSVTFRPPWLCRCTLSRRAYTEKNDMPGDEGWLQDSVKTTHCRGVHFRKDTSRH